MSLKNKIKNSDEERIEKINNSGFTLIELLAVIIILGVIMLIAIPSVTRQISESRKKAYVDTAKEVVAGARTVVNQGDLTMYDLNTTYYIPSRYIKTENSLKSPYGEFTEAYVGVIYTGDGYRYYWISVDETGQGIKNITDIDKLDTKDIESNIKAKDIKDIVEKIGIGDRDNIKILDPETETWIDFNVEENVDEDGFIESENPVCKPATVLHTATCIATELACFGAGYTGSNNLITYGTIKNGNPKAGDAYDCKLTQNGDFTERFYYVGKKGKYSILIYYKNMNNQSMYAYDSSNKNWYGPRTAYQYLPNINEWNNPGIIAPSESRQIINEIGSGITTGGTIQSFTYSNKAARFLTIQELVEACSSISSVGDLTIGELDGCPWLMESLGQYEGTTGSFGYWLEEPCSFDSSRVWNVLGYRRRVSHVASNSNSYHGVRPVITVLTSDLLR